MSKSSYVTTHKGVCIYHGPEGFVWDEEVYGMESDDVFSTLEAAKADIDCFFDDGPAPIVWDGEIIHPEELR